MAGVGSAPSGTKGAKYVRDLQPFSRHEAAGSSGRQRSLCQMLQRALDRARDGAGDLAIAGGGLDLLVPQQDLDHPDIPRVKPEGRLLLQKVGPSVCGETLTRANSFIDDRRIRSNVTHEDPIKVRQRRELAVPKLLWLFVATLVALPSFAGESEKRESESGDGKVKIGGERPFDEVNIFGDLGRIFRLQNTEENKIWWERMVRGEVGKDRFLILCALKDGNWKNLGNIRNYLEFKFQGTYAWRNLRKMLVLMAGRPGQKYTPRDPKSQQGKVGEGWLEKKPHAALGGIDTEWRIEPSVYPLLYFLLMSCPGDDRCE